MCEFVSKEKLSLFSLLALGDVVKAVDGPRNFSTLIFQRTDILDASTSRTVGLLDYHFRVTRFRYFSAQHREHGTRLVRDEPAVGRVKFERAEKPLVGISQCRLAAPQLSG